jgi:Serine-pyruvate aminotransferase/archaeal aspartate aminotransferase
MEGRRHRQLFAKRLHAAAGARLQRDLGKGARRRQDQQDAAVLLGLGGNVEAECERLLPYTPATNLLYGLREAIAMLLEEGLEAVFARHQRLAAAARTAVQHWGLEVLCLEPSDIHRCSPRC